MSEKKKIKLTDIESDDEKIRKLLLRQARKKETQLLWRSNAVASADDKAEVQSSDDVADADSKSSSESDNDDTLSSVKKKKTNEKEKNN